MKAILGLVLALFTMSAMSADSPLTKVIASCEGCHGANSVPVATNIPILSGQQYYYLYVQLKDYKAGRRENAIMTPMTQNLSKADMKALAEYFSTKPWPNVDSFPNSELADMGNSALDAGQCSQCHSKYKGDSRIPRVAGQQLDYMIQTMSDFKNKVRLNSPAKGSLFSSFSDEDLVAMSHYLSGLQ
ncbi:MAG: cytochrome c553 [Granulosicoccus sp.]|jgi:cytochrome c553